jgi:outer membrane lipoprotein-sorting protein
MLHMRRRDLLTALTLAPLGASLVSPAGAVPATPQDQPDLDRLVDYLNAMRSLRARFEQVAPDGALSRGTVWLERPGRIRFQYDPPTPILLIAGHGEVWFHDFQLNQTSTISLSRTPLSILLADKITFSGPVTVTDIQRLPSEIQVSLVRTANPGEGLLAMVFTDNPLQLYQWTVVDAQHKITRVTLSNIQLGGHFDDNLFTFSEQPPR